MNKIIIATLVVFTFLSKKTFAQLTLPYTFENNSEYSDSEIYIGLVGKTTEIGDIWMDMSTSEIKEQSSDLNTIAGPEWSQPAGWLYPDIFAKLSDIKNNTIQIPQGLFACRIFISFESPMYLRFNETGGYAGANLSSDSDPNDGIRWEIIELTWGDSGLWTNTSRVDAYQYPMALEVNGFFGGVNPILTYEEQYEASINGAGTAQYKKIGEVLPHNEILAAWNNNVSESYAVAKVIKEHSIDGGPIIEQPSKVDKFPTNTLDDYIDDIWSTYTDNDLVLNIGDRGVWTGRVNSEGYFVFTDSGNTSAIATIYGKPTTVGALEGSDTLAYTPVEASDDLTTHNNDLMIQAQISAAITRHAIYTDITDGTIQYTHDAERFFQRAPYNEYASFFHSEEISFESQTYAFAYDDVGDHSSTIQSTFPTDVKVIIGGYGNNTAVENVLTSLEISTESESFTTDDTIKFEAQAYNQFGRSMTTNVEWSISSGEAIINQAGYFNTSIAGDYIITATQGEISEDYILSITPAGSFGFCTGAPSNSQYSYSVTNENTNPKITFIPENGNGLTSCILYYGTTEDGNYPGQTVTANEPFQIEAEPGETIYFYYTYSLSSGGENKTSNDLQRFQVGNCSATLGLFDFNFGSDFGNDFILYPNPTNGLDAHVSGLDEDVTIDIYTLNGKLISSDVSVNVDTVKVNTTNLVSGLYLLAVSTKDNEFTKTFKLIVN